MWYLLILNLMHVFPCTNMLYITLLDTLLSFCIIHSIPRLHFRSLARSTDKWPSGALNGWIDTSLKCYDFLSTEIIMFHNHIKSKVCIHLNSKQTESWTAHGRLWRSSTEPIFFSATHVSSSVMIWTSLTNSALKSFDNHYPSCPWCALSPVETC